MVKAHQQARGPNPVQRQNPSKKTLETLQPVVERIDPTPRRIPLWPMVGRTDLTSRSLTSIDVGGGVNSKRRIPILRWIGDQTRSRGDTTDGYSDGQVSAANGGQTSGCIHSVFKWQPRYWGYTLLSTKNNKKQADGGQTDGYKYSACGLRSKGRDQTLYQASTKNG